MQGCPFFTLFWDAHKKVVLCHFRRVHHGIQPGWVVGFSGSHHPVELHSDLTQALAQNGVSCCASCFCLLWVWVCRYFWCLQVSCVMRGCWQWEKSPTGLMLQLKWEVSPLTDQLLTRILTRRVICIFWPKKVLAFCNQSNTYYVSCLFFARVRSMVLALLAGKVADTL